MRGKGPLFDLLLDVLSEHIVVFGMEVLNSLVTEAFAKSVFDQSSSREKASFDYNQTVEGKQLIDENSREYCSGGGVEVYLSLDSVPDVLQTFVFEIPHGKNWALGKKIDKF